MTAGPVHPHRLEVPSSADPDAVYDAFTTWTTHRGLTLYPAQDEGVVEVVSGSNLVLATPTGSGKSLVAVAAHLSALAAGRRTYYTAPIKALVSEKFFELVRTFGAERVGMVTGDASVNADAPIIACTAEILANVALRGGRDADVGQAVMDEFHYYGDHQRGWAWQVPLVELPQTQFVLMSATLGDTTDLRADLTRRTGRPTALVAGAERPVPLSYRFSMDPLHEALQELLDAHEAPVYVVHPTQAAAAERAQALMSVNVCSRAEKAAIAELIGDFRFTAGFGRTLSRLVRHGIGVHHAGMLPRYRRLVERLAQSGLLKVVCGTDTLGVGINVPIRTVLLVGLTKYDGRRVRRLNAREFHQISGRAGRAGFDTSGTVVVQAPEHVIEDHRAVLKAGDDPKKRRKVVRHKPPEGFVGWSQQTFENLVAAEPEPLQSRMMVSHAMLLNTISRPGDTLEHLRHLLRENQERPAAQVRLVRRAVQLYRELLAAGVVEQLAEPDETGRRARLTVDLRADFALDRPLSAFALAVLDVLDRDAPTYPLDVVSVLEATLDDPMPVLMAQRNRARGEAVEQMKADGLEYEERVELVDEIGWPQPLADLLDVTFETYRAARPWLAATPPSPKSVVRDMAERGLTFTETVSLYGLQRSEGLLLRYLSDAVRALRRTVPDAARTDELDDLTTWLAEVVRQTDSSLLDEWEQLSHPEAVEAAVDARPLDAAPPPVTANARAFRVLVRNAMFHRVELLARYRYGDLGELDGDAGWTAQAWADAMQPYRDAHADVGTGPQARGPALLQVDAETDPDAWLVRQVLDDPDGDHDWAITARVDLAASDALGEPAVEVLELTAL
ncbi:DEAD/DEAH box helicase [Angustibacter aerolatus]